MAAAGFETGYYKTQAPRSLGNAALYLFIEQIAVASGAGQSQNEHIVFDAVDEQPVWLDVTFAMADPIAGQSVVSVFLWERFPT